MGSADRRRRGYEASWDRLEGEQRDLVGTDSDDVCVVGRGGGQMVRGYHLCMIGQSWLGQVVLVS